MGMITFDKEGDCRDTATRLHHTLVKIHPFPNGNGRWALLISDLWLLKMGHPALSWGGNITKVTFARADYIASLKEADKSNYEPL